MTNTLLFCLFALTLGAIARFHRHALPIACTGMLAVLAVQCTLPEFDFLLHLQHEWRVLANLAGLLLGFAALAAHFEHSHAPTWLTAKLPEGRTGAFVLLALIALLSAALDNIAAALIGGTAAMTVFRGRVHVGYLAAIVAASNAGGAGSVVGDTTTTMLWVAGASPLWVAEAALGAVVALAFFGYFASGQQQALQPLVRSTTSPTPVDRTRLGIVLLVLALTIAANLWLDFPAVGVWTALLLGAWWRAPDWRVVRSALPGMGFLLCLVFCASMMPVKALPAPSVLTTFGLGFVSAVFDNIPLTKLAIDQNGQDWGMLAFAVGYGGSMLWFGSSAGVAIAGVFPAARSVGSWLRHGWHVAVGFGLGFLAMYAVFGFHPHDLPPPDAISAPVLERNH